MWPLECATPLLKRLPWLPVSLRRKLTLVDMLTRLLWAGLPDFVYLTSCPVSLTSPFQANQSTCSSQTCLFSPASVLGLCSPLCLEHSAPHTSTLNPRLHGGLSSRLPELPHCHRDRHYLSSAPLPTESRARVCFISVLSKLCPEPRRPGGAQSG